MSEDDASRTDDAKAGAGSEGSTPPPLADDAAKDPNAEAREAAQKALAESKQMLDKGVATFKGLDRNGQIYLAGLAVFIVFGAIFAATSGDITWEGSTSPYHAQQLNKLEDIYNENAVSILGMGWVGKLAFLAGLAGIGLFCWNLMAKKKEAWAPLALIGAAGLVSLLLLFIMVRAGGSVSQTIGLGSNETFDIDMTLLGFWLPLAGAIAATVSAVRTVTRA